MPRRTVTVPLGFDRAIRSLQAQSMKKLNRDYSYTEALNVVLFWGFSQPVMGMAKLPSDGAKLLAFWKEDDREATDEDLAEVFEGYNEAQLMLDGKIDSL